MSFTMKTSISLLLRWLTIIPAAVLLLRPVDLLAWGAFGHEVIAIVAWRQLPPHDREALNQIFSGAPEIYGDQTGLDAFEYASTLPDQLRTEYRFKHHNEPLHIFQSIGVTHASGADALHFADYSRDEQIVTHNGVDVINAVLLADQALGAADSTPRQRAEAVTYLVHCVGDAHQPLHCGYADDEGGNAIALSGLGRHHTHTELHAVWDTGLFYSTGIHNPADYVDQRLGGVISGIQESAVQNLDPAAWVAESHELAKSAAYVDENGDPITSGEHLSEAYVVKNLPTADQRLAQAGVRLAALIHAALNQ
jgi:hypothetical protein